MAERLASKPRLRVEKLGLQDYLKTLARQRALVKRGQEQGGGDHLLLVEHDLIATIGTGGDFSQVKASAEWFKRREIKIVPVDRGGGVTLHSPGQLVAYPIVNLRASRDLHLYLRQLELVVVRTLADFGIEGTTRIGKTGVWLGNDKIAAIGIKVEKWITSHGFALNIANDLTLYSAIDQCGLKDAGVMSIKAASGIAPEFELVRESVIQNFTSVFGYEKESIECLGALHG